MDTEYNKNVVRKVMERAFNQGDLTILDDSSAPDGIDHQEPPGTDFIAHLKQVVTAMRAAFPDLHFEIHDILSEGDIVAFRSTMSGTHQGTFSMMPSRPLSATGRKLSVPHMHFLRLTDGKVTDLWHIWNIPMMMQQLGAGAEQPNRA